ncbi:MAG: hypothetical protein QM783_02790 [Phycisphaerales bacterium]
MIKLCRDAIRVLSMPCSAHALHLSRQMDDQLTRGERIGLWIHLRGCTACRAFAKQLTWLRSLAQQDAAAQPAQQTMPHDVRDRLTAAVRQSEP